MAKRSFKTHPQAMALPTSGKRYEAYRDSGERGKGRLGVEVSATGTKRWLFRYFIEGKAKFIRLGLVSDQYRMTHAQEECDKYSQWLAQGKDPKQELERIKKNEQAARQKEAQQGNIEQLFNGYVEKMKRDGKRTYQSVQKALEKEVFPVIDRKTKAKDVLPTDVVCVLSGMIQEPRKAVVQSNRVRSYMMAAFNYGLKADHDPMTANTGVKYGLMFNPVSAVPKQAQAEKVGDNWLLLSEVRELINSFDDVYKVGAQMSALMKLCFFTGGQRPYELAASRWKSVNWEEKTLLITADVSKNKRPHLVPLTDSTIALLQSIQLSAPNSPFIFHQRTNHQAHLRTASLAKAIARFRAEKPDFKHFVARDIRRTCKTLMGELGISKEIRDRLQNHALNDVSSKHYDRYSYLPEKRQALEAWEKRLHQTASGSNIGQLKGA